MGIPTNTAGLRQECKPNREEILSADSSTSEMDIFLDEDLRYDFFLNDWFVWTSLCIEYSYSVETFFVVAVVVVVSK